MPRYSFTTKRINLADEWTFGEVKGNWIKVHCGELWSYCLYRLWDTDRLIQMIITTELHEWLHWYCGNDMRVLLNGWNEEMLVSTAERYVANRLYFSRHGV